LAKQSKFTSNVEQWGTKLLAINWKFIIKRWTIRNLEVKGETPEKADLIQQQDMINEIIHIQTTHSHLPTSATTLSF
jgi:hypothetical protein